MAVLRVSDHIAIFSQHVVFNAH